MRPFLVMILLIVLAAPTNAGQDEFQFNLHGNARRYQLYTPANMGRFSGPRPLVLVLHGGGGTDRGLIRQIGKSFYNLADKHGFYVAFPNAVRRSWDFGQKYVAFKRKRRVNDLAYLKKVLVEISRRKQIDRSRIFATGISQGGQASFYLACKLPGRIRAIASVAMPLPTFMQDVCRRARPVPLALFNGTQDPIVPYNGGPIRVGRKSGATVLSTDATVALFRTVNGCSKRPAVRRSINTKRDGTKVIRVEWTRCRRAPVVLYRIDGGGHTWPSGPQYLPRWAVGKVTRDIDGTKEIWAFFSRF